MFKKYLILGLLAFSIDANAYMIEHDWLANGDKNLTFISELNIEILDVSFTNNTSHAVVAKELGGGGLYSGFRFLNNTEVETIVDIYFGGNKAAKTQSLSLTPGSNASNAMTKFLNFIGAPGSPTLTFNTCEHALGCKYYSPNDPSHSLVDSDRWIFALQGVARIGWDESPIQLLVRDVITVPEPASVFLLILGILVIVVLRFRLVQKTNNIPNC